MVLNKIIYVSCNLDFVFYFFICEMEKEIYNSKWYVNVIVISIVTIAWKFFKRKLIKVTVDYDKYQCNQNAFALQ